MFKKKATAKNCKWSMHCQPQFEMRQVLSKNSLKSENKENCKYLWVPFPLLYPFQFACKHNYYLSSIFVLHLEQEVVNQNLSLQFLLLNCSHTRLLGVWKLFVITKQCYCHYKYSWCDTNNNNDGDGGFWFTNITDHGRVG